jgi:hypothetical protein
LWERKLSSDNLATTIFLDLKKKFCSKEIAELLDAGILYNPIPQNYKTEVEGN